MLQYVRELASPYFRGENSTAERPNAWPKVTAPMRRQWDGQGMQVKNDIPRYKGSIKKKLFYNDFHFWTEIAICLQMIHFLDVFHYY